MTKEIPKKTKGKCPECGSSLHIEEGQIVCSQDLLKEEYPNLFREWDKLPEGKRQQTLEQVSFRVYDMYQRWSSVNEFGERLEFCCTYNPNVEFNPMTQNEQILPDPIQTKISEIILDRGLTEEEYCGIVKVPLLNDVGEIYYGQIEQLVFPRDYISRQSKREEEIPFEKLFDLEELRGKKNDSH